MGYQFVISPKLEAKKELIKLLAVENNHVLLTGNRNSGKSNFM
jgi:transcriptional regulator with AAA-type ATPase domain